MRILPRVASKHSGFASILFCAVSCLAGPQQTAAPAGSAATSVGSVTGFLIDVVTGRPVTHPLEVAAVRSPTLHPSCQVHADGRFVCKDLPPGPYNLIVSQAGQRLRTGYRRVEVTPGGALSANVLVRLNASISGTVTDPERSPVRGARVLLIAPEYVMGRLAYSIESSAQTDETGAYSIRNRVQSGNPYLLFALPPRKNAATIEAITSTKGVGKRHAVLQPSWFPGPPLPAAVSRFAVSSMEERIINLSLPAAPGYCLDGAVVSPGSMQDIGIEIAVEEVSGYAPGNGAILQDGMVYAGKPTPKGSFSVCSLWPGRYRLRASAPDGRYGDMAVTIADDDIRDLRLPVHSPISVTGVVRRYPSETQSDQSSISVAFIPWSRYLFPGEPASTYRVKTTKEGLFNAAVPAATDYIVTIGPPKGYLKELRTADGRVLGDSRVRADEANVSLEIIIGDDAGDVVASVTGQDGKPDSNVFVCVVPVPAKTIEDVAGRSTCKLVTAADGLASFSLAPGRYFALATPYVDSLSRMEWLYANKGRGEQISIEPVTVTRVMLSSPR